MKKRPYCLPLFFRHQILLLEHVVSQSCSGVVLNYEFVAPAVPVLRSRRKYIPVDSRVRGELFSHSIVFPSTLFHFYNRMRLSEEVLNNAVGAFQ